MALKYTSVITCFWLLALSLSPDRLDVFPDEPFLVKAFSMEEHQ
jgi:hypothetical protein